MLKIIFVHAVLYHACIISMPYPSILAFNQFEFDGVWRSSMYLQVTTGAVMSWSPQLFGHHVVSVALKIYNWSVIPWELKVCNKQLKVFRICFFSRPRHSRFCFPFIFCVLCMGSSLLLKMYSRGLVWEFVLDVIL